MSSSGCLSAVRLAQSGRLRHFLAGARILPRGGGNAPGAPATEDVFDRDNPNPRRASELAGEQLAARGVSVAAMR